MPGSALDLQLTFDTGHALTNVEKAEPSRSSLLWIKRIRIEAGPPVGHDDAKLSSPCTRHRNMYWAASTVLQRIEQQLAHRSEEEDTYIDGFRVRRRVGFHIDLNIVVFPCL